MAEATVTKYLPEVVILGGLPASGKTTEALKWVKADEKRRTRINYDELRLAAGIKPGTFNRKSEDAIQAQAVEQFHNAMRLGMSVVIDNTNLTPKARKKWHDLATPYGVTITEREISDIPIDTLVKRDLKRGPARVGRAVIERMALFNGHIDWSDWIYRGDPFVICDLDGTLADITHRRHFVDGSIRVCSGCGEDYLCPGIEFPACTNKNCDGRPLTHQKKDWKSFLANVADDALNAPVAELLDMFKDDGYKVLIVSGRPINPCGIPTEDWLNKHEVPYTHLFMRASGDNRPDTIIKKEILDLLPVDRIDYVLDDRQSVVDMWRDNGLFVLQVARGDF